MPVTADGKLQDLIEAAKAHVRAKVEHPFRVIKQQFGFQKTLLRGLAKNSFKINMLAALANLFLARRQLPRQPEHGDGVSKRPDSESETSQKGLETSP
jgi:IS5 family transposase